MQTAVRVPQPAVGACAPTDGRSPADSYCPLLATRPYTSTIEPMLIPKLRIHFADFPDSHSSIDQRLHTLETCCGYEYDQIEDLFSPPCFQGPIGALLTRRKVFALSQPFGTLLQTICFRGHRQFD